jgi:hypothetical protein
MEATMASGKAKEPFPFDNNKVNFSKFKPKVSATEIAKLVWPGWPGSGIYTFPFGPIDALSPIKTVGKGRTNLTLVSPTIFQIDANCGSAKASVAERPIALPP